MKKHLGLGCLCPKIKRTILLGETPTLSLRCCAGLSHPVLTPAGKLSSHLLKVSGNRRPALVGCLCGRGSTPGCPGLPYLKYKCRAVLEISLLWESSALRASALVHKFWSRRVPQTFGTTLSLWVLSLRKTSRVTRLQLISGRCRDTLAWIG